MTAGLKHLLYKVGKDIDDVSLPMEPARAYNLILLYPSIHRLRIDVVMATSIEPTAIFAQVGDASWRLALEVGHDDEPWESCRSHDLNHVQQS